MSSDCLLALRDPLSSPLSCSQVFIDLDVAKAEATEESDLCRIMKDIQDDVGVQAMTHQVSCGCTRAVIAHQERGLLLRAMA